MGLLINWLELMTLLHTIRALPNTQLLNGAFIQIKNRTRLATSSGTMSQRRPSMHNAATYKKSGQ